MVGRGSDVVAVILARGGSRGIPRKNVVDFLGRPLIVWTLMQVREAGINRIYVSTDDKEISQISESAGAGVIPRPQELAGDLASGDQALIHGMEFLRLPSDTIIVMPQVTSPLRLPEHIEDTVGAVASGMADSVFTANRMDDICVWELTGAPRSITYDYRNRGMRQQRPTTVVENGSVYCTTAGAVRSSGNRLSGRIHSTRMPRWTMPQIDEPEDLALCEILMRAYVVNELGSQT